MFGYTSLKSVLWHFDMRRKKARREAPGQEDRVAIQRLPQQQQRRRQNRQNRRAAQTSAGPSASFLEALEEQRRRQEDVQPEPATLSGAAAVSKPRAELPGYYYDEEKGKYFPITDAYRVAQQKTQKRERLMQQLKTNEQQFKRTRRVTTSWVRYLAERESRFGWSANQRDQRELMPQFASARMVMLVSRSLWLGSQLTN